MGLPSPPRTLLYSFLLFVFFGVVQEYDDLFRTFFFIGIIPATWVLLYKEGLWASIRHDNLFWLVLMLLTTLYLSVFWSDTDDFSRTVIRYSRWYLWTSIFFIAMFIYGYLDLHKTKTHGLALQFTIILGATSSIVVYIVESRFPARITGMGMLDQIIMSSSLLIMLWVMSLSGMDITKRKDLVLSMISFTIVLTYACLNQSRAPLAVTIFAGTIFILALISPSKRKIIAIGVILAISSILVWHFDALVLFERMLNRGSSYRLIIWEASISQLKDYVWFGFGIASQLSETSIGSAIKAAMGIKFNHTHNLFLTVLAYGGILPFLLLVTAFFTFTIRALKLKGKERTIAITTIISLLGLCFTDPYKIITSPQEMWVLFWFPIGVLCGALSLKSLKGGMSFEHSHPQEKLSPL